MSPPRLDAIFEFLAPDLNAEDDEEEARLGLSACVEDNRLLLLLPLLSLYAD